MVQREGRMKVLVTGGLGLIGSACCKHFADKGWEVIAVDNNTRQAIFGADASTAVTADEEDVFSRKGVEIVEADIRDKDKMEKIIKNVDAVVHLAAQPSHPRSLEIPMEDFQINAFGTLQLLELTRQHNHGVPFAFMSTNKVYGDYPNYFNYKIVGKRYENTAVDSFDEQLPIDRCGHTPFGVSKAAADLYTQEYGINYGMKTATFRGGCLTGKNSRAVEMHGYLPYIIKCALLGQHYNIYGGGYRVRDQIHSSDVASAIYEFINRPKPNALGQYGQAYNIGGGRQNSISIFETIDAIKAKTGIDLKWTEAKERESDHIWWISNNSKLQSDYPKWKITKNLDFIFNEILEYYINKNRLSIKLQNAGYFSGGSK
ncbi:MAG: SDR family NAD(P)-dependent oxidoreductase [Candidatus Aenigmatarchaeota archaeon]